jgi:hypothetical protein
MYILGDETAEFCVRVHKGKTTNEVNEGLRRIHAGIDPAKILFEGSEMADEDPVTDWATATGTSPLRVKITLDSPMQKFWLWQHSGHCDLGSEELDGRSKEEVWRSLQLINSTLGGPEEYRMFKG